MKIKAIVKKVNKWQIEEEQKKKELEFIIEENDRKMREAKAKLVSLLIKFVCSIVFFSDKKSERFKLVGV